MFVFVTGIVAGSYPALYLSSFQPVKVLKGALGAGRASVVPRKALVVFQFTISVAFMVPMTTGDFNGKYDLFRTELLGSGHQRGGCEVDGVDRSDR